MSTDIIDTSFHGSAFPSTYIGPGTIPAHCAQSAGTETDVHGYFTSAGNAVQLNVGFKPLEVRIINTTDAIEWEWMNGFPATNTIKTVLGGSLTRALDATSAIVVSEPAPNGGGNWIVTLSAALVGSAKNICFKVEG